MITMGWDTIPWILVGLFLISSLLLFRRQRRLQSKLEEITTKLNRAVQGNLATRVLSAGEPAVDELIYSLNELIAQLKKVQVQTIRSEAARKSLLSSISHDIRTPLTSIIGYVEALKDDIAVSEQEREEYLEIISRKAAALKELIEDIFQMAKLDADEIPLRLEPLDLAELAREALIECLPQLMRHQMEPVVQIPEQSCFVQADRLSILRTLSNLLKNAMQYGREGQIVGIELIERPTEYRLLIWDRGAGIAQEDLPHVFERMYRADRSRGLHTGGSGLGLAIAKALVEKHSGEIWVESIPGDRTTFGFSIPKAHHLRNS
jgi:signal transduction histidine kinase